MAEMQINPAHRNGIVAAAADPFGGGKLRVLSGTRPGVTLSETGTLLVAIDPLPDPAFSLTTTGQVGKVGSWSAEVAATGAPGYFRLTDQDAGARREGDAGSVGSGATMEIDGLVDGDLIEGGTFTVESYTITVGEGDVPA